MSVTRSGLTNHAASPVRLPVNLRNSPVQPRRCEAENAAPEENRCDGLEHRRIARAHISNSI